MKESREKITESVILLAAIQGHHPADEFYEMDEETPLPLRGHLRTLSKALERLSAHLQHHGSLDELPSELQVELSQAVWSNLDLALSLELLAQYQQLLAEHSFVFPYLVAWGIAGAPNLDP